MKTYALSIFISITYLIPSVSIADYGESFLSIHCDKKKNIFEIEPLIIWNEKLDAIASELKNKKGKIIEGDTHLINFVMNKNIDFSCKLANDTLRINNLDYFRDLKIYKNNKLIVSPKVKDVWDFYGYIFKVRYTKTNGWEEFCGRVEAIKKWKPLNTTRKDTNCK